MVAAVLSAVPTAAAVACPAAEIIDVNCDNAELALVLAVLAVPCAVDAFVNAVDALLEAVFAVEVVAAAAVCTSEAECPVVVPPVRPCHRSSHPVWMFVTAVLRAAPTADAVD